MGRFKERVWDRYVYKWIALLSSIIGGVVARTIARCVVGKWICNLVLEKLQDVIDDFECTSR